MRLSILRVVRHSLVGIAAEWNRGRIEAVDARFGANL